MFHLCFFVSLELELFVKQIITERSPVVGREQGEALWWPGG